MLKNKNPLRVAMLTLHSCPLGKLGTRDTGGMSLYVRYMAQSLAHLGIRVDVFTRQDEEEPLVPLSLGEGSRLIHLPVGKEETKLGLYPYLPDFACAIHRFKEQEGIDYHLVHSHYWLSGWVGKVLAHWWQVPHVVTLHTSALAKNRALGWEEESELRIHTEREVLAQAHRIVALCQREKEGLVENYGAGPEKVAVVPGGVDLGLFRPLSRRRSKQALGLSGRKVILFVGRTEAIKGVNTLLEATALVSPRYPVHLALVGGELEGDDEIEKLRSLAREGGLEGRVSFFGTVEQKELPLYYSAADVCVLPSYYETFGLTILESLACGTPVIATRVGCADEIIYPGWNGLLLDQPSPASLAALLEMALGPDGLQHPDAIRSSVVHLTWPAAARRMAAEYQGLLAEFKPIPEGGGTDDKTYRAVEVEGSDILLLHS